MLSRSEPTRFLVGEPGRSRRQQSAIRARDVRAADLQEKPTKRVENRADAPQSHFVGFDEDGGYPANIAASGASQGTERAQRVEQSSQAAKERPDERA